MKKINPEEIYPRNEIAKKMVNNRMKNHYRRVYNAKAQVDTNLPKPSKNSFPLSREICDVVERNYHCYKDQPKHRRCIEELKKSGLHFKPVILPTKTESKLKTLDVYQAPVRTHRHHNNLQKIEDAVEKIEENELENEEATNAAEVRTVIENCTENNDNNSKREVWVQTDRRVKEKSARISSPFRQYRPANARTLHFLRDVTDDVLRKGVYTDDCLERVFNHHLSLNEHNLDVETMQRELDRLRNEVGMARPGLRSSVHSDDEAIQALNSLQLDPQFRDDIINSLRLCSRESYHTAIIEPQLSTSSSQYSIINSQLFYLPENKLSIKDVDGSKKEGSNGQTVLDNQLEKGSTTSEVSDIQEIEIADDTDDVHASNNDLEVINVEEEQVNSLVNSSENLANIESEHNSINEGEGSIIIDQTKVDLILTESRIKVISNESIDSYTWEKDSSDPEEPLVEEYDSTGVDETIDSSMKTELIVDTDVEEDEGGEQEGKNYSEGNKEDSEREDVADGGEGSSSEISSVHTEPTAKT